MQWWQTRCQIFLSFQTICKFTFTTTLTSSSKNLIKLWVVISFIVQFLKNFLFQPNITIAEVLDKLPYFPKFELTTFSPYDINRVDSELVVQDQNKASNVKLYTSIALGLIATITIVALTGFCVYMRYNNDISIVTSDTVPESLNVLKQYSMPDIVREQSFRPSASSTFRSSH